MNLRLILTIGTAVLISCGDQKQNNNENQDNNNEASTHIEVNDDLKKQFTTDVSNYLSAFNNGDWDAVTDMVYPKLFDVITKEQMVQSFSQIEEMGMEVKSDFNNIEKISKVITHENSKFCRVYYHGSLTIKISGLMLENIDQITQSFNDAYGADNVKYDDTNNAFDINAQKSMIAVSKMDANDWKYMEYNDQQQEMLKQLIPEQVLNQLID